MTTDKMVRILNTYGKVDITRHSGMNFLYFYRDDSSLFWVTSSHKSKSAAVRDMYKDIQQSMSEEMDAL